MKIWKKFYCNWNNELNDGKFPSYQSMLPFVVLFLFLCIFPSKISNACGPTDRVFHGYSFINPKIVEHERGFAPWFLDFTSVYDDHFRAESEEKLKDNLAEWSERFCGLVEEEDLQYIIYKASISDLEALKTAVRSKNIPVPLRLRANSFAIYVKEHGCEDTVDYLIFAKKCEPYVIAFDNWQNVERDFSTMYNLIEEGKQIFDTEKKRLERKGKGVSPYLKLRYAYQIIRLAHYSKEYELTLELHDELIPRIDKDVSRMEESILYYWIMGHRAGAMQSLGQKVEANYLFSKIFQNCPSKRESAFRSFSVKSNEEWEACLLMCRDDHERATLYALRGNIADARALEEMQMIYQIDPTNEDLELLLVKEMGKLEKNLLGLEFNDKKRQNKRYYNIPKAYAEDYVIELQEFARKCREEEQVKNPLLWRLAEGYLELLSGDFYAAGKTFNEVERRVDDPILEEQLATFQLALTISAYESMTADVEDEVYDILKDNETYQSYPDFPDFLRDKLAFLYKKEKRPGKAFMCQYQLDDLKPNPKDDILNDLLRVIQNEDSTQFERLLTSDLEGNRLTYDIWDIKGTVLMQDNQLEAALEAFKEIPRSQWDDYGVFQPFRDPIKECVNCLFPRDTASMYNKGEFIEEILDLEYKARGAADNNAAYYYRMAVGLYNTTYFGYSWKLMDYFRSGSSWPRLYRDEDKVFSSYGHPFGNKEHVGLDRAIFLLEKAIFVAQNPELKARAAFMLAKCQQKQYFINKNYQAEPCCNRIPNLPDEYLTGYNILVQELNETSFYSQVIKECKYFRAYVSSY